MVNKYLGHYSQLYGVEEHKLVGGKGDGMRLLQVKNGLGLEFTVSADRCADLARLSFQGVNFGYFSPCGYVSPQYYDDKGRGFLKSFTTGFLTTCGLRAAGASCEDQGEQLPMHGTISNTPADHISWRIEDNRIHIQAEMYDASIFADKLVLKREIICYLDKNVIEITDQICNFGDTVCPLMLLYHFNVGYPLLSESAKLCIPSDQVVPRDAQAKTGLSSWNQVTTPQEQFQEQCFYHQFSNQGLAGIFNPSVDKGFTLKFDTDTLDCFTQWKMMGICDYVMGLEPGNCNPDGRDIVRKQDKLKFIAPQEKKTFHLQLDFFDKKLLWDESVNVRSK